MKLYKIIIKLYYIIINIIIIIILFIRLYKMFLEVSSTIGFKKNIEVKLLSRKLMSHFWYLTSGY